MVVSGLKIRPLRANAKSRKRKQRKQAFEGEEECSKGETNRGAVPSPKGHKKEGGQSSLKRQNKDGTLSQSVQ